MKLSVIDETAGNQEEVDALFQIAPKSDRLLPAYGKLCNLISCLVVLPLVMPK